jgi:hypothetical protein
MNAQHTKVKAGKTPFFDYKSAALPTELYRRDFLQTLCLPRFARSGKTISEGQKKAICVT